MTSALAGADIGATLTRLRQSTPLVHSITNYVAMNPAANVLLALGASPAMVHAAEEAAEFAALADALVINIGTLSAPWVDAMLSAAESAQQQQTPWVLDPVAIGATRFRRDACARLLEFSPTIIRGNASEIIALAGDALGGRGVDSTAASDEALTAAVAPGQTSAGSGRRHRRGRPGHGWPAMCPHCGRSCPDAASHGPWLRSFRSGSGLRGL